MPSLGSIPNELKREIASFCDTPTKVQLALVSVAFHQISSPLLLQTLILVDSFKKLYRLFSHRVRTNAGVPELPAFITLTCLSPA